MAGRLFNRIRPSVSDFFFSYSSVKEIEVHHTYVALFYRILQFMVLAYIVFHIVLMKRGYQQFQEPRGSSVIKVKGVARVSIGTSHSYIDKSGRLLWDAAEYGIPPIENNALFIATRKTVTHVQKEDTCPTALKDKLFCNSTYNPCKVGKPTPNSFGFFTGNCVPSQEDLKRNVCEIFAWCPEELSNSTDYKINIDDLRNFTIFIKTAVSFTQFNVKVRTVKDDTNFSCRFSNATSPRCPIFQIDYIIQKLQEQNPTMNLMALFDQGGLIQIQQDWNCNFDSKKGNRECFPTYIFNLLQSGDDKMSPGINYRFARKHRANEIEYRTLTKVYGLRFVLMITGSGGQFDVFHLFVAIGSGIGYMTIAELVCEFIFTRLHKYRKEYQQNKVKRCNFHQDKQSDRTKLTTMRNPPRTSELISTGKKQESTV